MATVDAERLAEVLRERSIRLDTQEILISRIEGSDQEGDLSEPPNCGGYGRLRHFDMGARSSWPANQLPIVPAAHRLGVGADAVSVAQVFQNASCNWRCWYCYVPFNLLAANPNHSRWLTPLALVDLYMDETFHARIIDCSGGQPDLVPEWIPWMMEALRLRGLQDSVYLWSDDNLSNDYFWRYLTRSQMETVVGYANYGRVGCFKGYNERSFNFNTKADGNLFFQQFALFKRLLMLGIDMYAYATFTAADADHLEADMVDFVDRLQDIHINLPLRVVPLRIEAFGVVRSRVGATQEIAMEVQEEAILCWNDVVTSRFTQAERQMPISDVPVVRG